MKVHEVWTVLLDKPPEILGDFERTLVQANIFAIDFENGSWLYNASPAEGESRRAWIQLRLTATALAAIDAVTAANYLLEIASIVETAGEEALSGPTWNEFLTHAILTRESTNC